MGERVIRELLPPDTGLAFEAMKALRTDLADRQSFVRAVDDVQRPAGYRLVSIRAWGWRGRTRTAST